MIASAIKVNVATEMPSENVPCNKQPGKARRAKKSPEPLAFLAFPCFFFTSKKPGKGRKNKESLGFLGKP